jgi:hypothetical protein
MLPGATGGLSALTALLAAGLLGAGQRGEHDYVFEGEFIEPQPKRKGRPSSLECLSVRNDSKVVL